MAKLRANLVLSKRLHAGVTAPRQYLTGLDIFHAHAGIPVVLVYKKGFDLAVAERALVETLKHYPIMTGRYKKDEQGQVYVDSNDAGIDFCVSRCVGKMPYGPENPAGKDDIKQFFKLVLPWQVVDKDTPLLQVNIFQYDDEGILMCCYAPHSLLDGSSYWGFMQNWSNACRGLEIKPPSFDRQVMIDAGQTEVEADSYDLMVAPGLWDYIGIMARLGWQAVTGLKSEVMRVPAQTVQQWKSQAKVEMPGSAGVSTVELVTAYVLKAFSPCMPRQCLVLCRGALHRAGPGAAERAGTGRAMPSGQ
jgi:shikimate O-hydroxycinnamoyltransferase